LLALAAVSASYAAYCGVIRWTGNFSVVEEGRFYRSAQLDKTGFERIIKDRGIRSILNLRGSSKGPWYRDEVAVSEAFGIVHYDYHLHSDQIVTPRQIDEILKIIRAAPKPILVHCSAGSDRTGLVSALYLFGVDRAGPNEAAMQLSRLRTLPISHEQDWSDGSEFLDIRPVSTMVPRETAAPSQPMNRAVEGLNTSASSDSLGDVDQ